MPGNGNNQDELNRMAPATSHAQLGTLLVEMIAAHNALVNRANSVILTKAGLAIKAGASAIVKAVSAFAAVVSGTIVRKAANTDMAALVGTLATARSAAWAFYIDAAGTLTTSTKTADLTTHALAIAALPATPLNKALIGWIVVDNATGTNFVGGTTALDTGSLTVTYYDSAGLPPGLTANGAVSLGDINSR
jgi:hypothetical protein